MKPGAGLKYMHKSTWMCNYVSWTWGLLLAKTNTFPQYSIAVVRLVTMDKKLKYWKDVSCRKHCCDFSWYSVCWPSVLFGFVCVYCGQIRHACISLIAVLVLNDRLVFEWHLSNHAGPGELLSHQITVAAFVLRSRCCYTWLSSSTECLLHVCLRTPSL